MKYLVLLVVVAIAIGIWRSRRAAEENASVRSAQPLALPQNMLACAHCGIHLPQAEALMVGEHAYCCADHQRRGPA